MSDISEAIQRIAIYAIPLLLGITCHEVAHGYVAWRQGDPTAKAAGRLTLNPIKHLDVTGTAVFVLTAYIGAFVIGWAKPIPVNAGYFKNPKKGMMLVSVAGPATNFVLAILFALLFHLCVAVFPADPHSTAAAILEPLARISAAGVWLNLILCIFNLIPIPPLDGSQILAGLLPDEAAEKYQSLERWGMLIIIGLLATGILGRIIVPPPPLPRRYTAIKKIH
jgi:Zn-dependent protease